MSREEANGDPYEGGVDSGGIPPTAKVRLPDHVTKLRKRSRSRSAGQLDEPNLDQSHREA
jgi:hypothetical protein